jgi:hypothetical protein
MLFKQLLVTKTLILDYVAHRWKSILGLLSDSPFFHENKLKRVQKTRQILFGLFQKAENEGNSVHQNLLSDRSIMAAKIDRVDQSVHHLRHVLDFKFFHLKNQVAKVMDRLDNITHLMQGPAASTDSKVTKKLRPLPGALALRPPPEKQSPSRVDFLHNVNNFQGPLEIPKTSVRKVRGLAKYRMVVALSAAKKQRGKEATGAESSTAQGQM